jgi:hypothetical protein
MSLSAKLTKRCNFFPNAPEWVMREEAERTVVLKLTSIPSDEFLYWVGGRVILAVGTELPAVFTIAGSGEIHQCFWLVGNEWFNQGDPALPSALGLRREQMFPYDWRLAVALDHDSYHGR